MRLFNIPRPRCMLISALCVPIRQNDCILLHMTVWCDRGLQEDRLHFNIMHTLFLSRDERRWRCVRPAGGNLCVLSLRGDGLSLILDQLTSLSHTHICHTGCLEVHNLISTKIDTLTTFKVTTKYGV